MKPRYAWRCSQASSDSRSSPDTLVKHQALARLSSKGRHLVAAKSGHWIQFDEPELVVRVVREVAGRDSG